MTACSIGSRGPWFNQRPEGLAVRRRKHEYGAVQPARLHIEALLRARRLDRTVTDPAAAPDPVRSRPTGFPWLDARLAGGWPCGETSEIVGPASSGRSSLLTASLAAATARGDVAALVDTHDTFDAASAEAAGLSLDHLLWARGDPAGVARPQMLLDRAIKAFGLVLEAGGFGVVALDLGDVAPADLSRLPFTTWRRLQRFVEGRDTIALVLAPVPVARSARGVTIDLSASTATWAGESRRACRLIGLSLAAQVRTARRM
jgi:recombination protein RecA